MCSDMILVVHQHYDVVALICDSNVEKTLNEKFYFTQRRMKSAEYRNKNFALQ